MKKQLQFCLVFTLLLCSCTIPKTIVLQHLDEDFVKIEGVDDVFFCKYEVSNDMYRTFLEDIEKKNPDLFAKCNVDVTQWTKEELGGYREPLARNYFSQVAYKDFPVVNISLFGAKQYCIWLTNKAENNDLDIVFRLPTYDEFMSLLETVGGDYTKGSTDRKLSAYNVQGSFMTLAYDAENQWGHDNTRYLQNQYGMYHIVGNVEELLQDGRSLGGHWASSPNEVTASHDYNVPDPRVGFRIVVEM